MSQHTTSVAIKNPSAAAALKISLQGRVAPEVKRHFDYVEDTRVEEIRPNSIGSLGGGQVTWARRFVLVADRATSVMVTSRSSNFVVEELKLVEYEDAGPRWEVARELAPATSGAKYEFGDTTRLAIRINQKDESLDDAYLNLRQVGDDNIKIIQQEERPVFRRTRAASWTPPAIAGEVPPGGSEEFMVSDSARLVIETNSKDDVPLEICNRNILHALQLANVDADGERIVAVIGQHNSGTAGLWAPGLQYAVGRVAVRKGLGAIVAQQPL